MAESSGLPIDAIIPRVRIALRDRRAAIVLAPPGAGKTTVVPLALRQEPWLGGHRIVMLEPRRLAARAAARRMAHLLSEPVGHTVGYRTRLDTRVSAATQIEVVTEGILTRIVQRDPTLDDYALVIFDEFHERNLIADVGLALALHTRRLLRPDLRILVMSATLEGTAVARLLDDAPIIASEGRQYPVETRYQPLAGTSRGRADHARLTRAVSTTILEALEDAPGDLLAFLPGTAEIHRTLQHLDSAIVPANTDVLPLHGMLRAEDQDRAIEPSRPGRRKVVLATSVAETSLTIDGVRIVVDSGLARRPRFSPRTGMSRLETTRVSRASADQRRGRAGRTAPGVCYRLWDETEQAMLLPFAPPEIVEGDLAPLMLDLAVAGVADPTDLAWLDVPPAAAWNQARELLAQLEALDDRGFPTAHGREMAQLGMHPRLAHMVLRAMLMKCGSLACDLAALLGERDPFGRASATGTVLDRGVDLRDRLDALRGRGAHTPHADRRTLDRIRQQARSWREQLHLADSPCDHGAAGRILALAFPDRVAQRRAGQASRYVLRSGPGALLPATDQLGAEPWLVIAESDGRAPEGRIYLAAPLTDNDIRDAFADQMTDVDIVEWDEETGIRARSERRLGAIVLTTTVVRAPRPELVAAALGDAIRRRGLAILPWSEPATRLRHRLAFLHRHDSTWPDMSEAALTEALLEALRAHLATVQTAEALRRVDVGGALMDLLDGAQRAQLELLAPTRFVAPTGSRMPIDYSDPDAPSATIRLQELFGCETTPAVFGNRVPITLHLLSPAHRPVQVTRDLAGFWRTSYFDVRKEMRARYPRHSWPDDPVAARPTTRTRRKG